MDIIKYVPFQLTKKHRQEFIERLRKFDEFWPVITKNISMNTAFASKHLNFQKKVLMIGTSETKIATPEKPVLCCNNVGSCSAFYIVTKTQRCGVHMAPEEIRMARFVIQAKKEIKKTINAHIKPIESILKSTDPKRLVVIHRHSSIRGSHTRLFLDSLINEYTFVGGPVFIQTKSTPADIYLTPKLEVLIDYTKHTALSSYHNPIPGYRYKK